MAIRVLTQIKNNLFQPEFQARAAFESVFVAFEYVVRHRMHAHRE